MNLRTPSVLLAAWVLAATTPLASQQTLILTNGDRISGELLGISNGSWRFRFLDTDQEISVSQIRTATSDSLIGIRLVDGSVLAARLAEDPSGVRLDLDDGSTRLISPAEIVAVGSPADLDALRPVEIGLFSPITRFWSALGSFGLSDKSGNSRARGVNLTLEFARNTERDRLEFTFGWNREDKRGDSGTFENTVSNYYASARGDLFLTTELFAFAATRFKRDVFQDITLGALYNIGAGIQAVSTPATDVRLSLSGGLRAESFVSGGAETDVVAGFEAALRQNFGLADLVWRLDWSGSAGDLTDYRVRSDAALIIGVLKELGFRFGILNEFNNQPQPGIEKHDLLITTTLSYALGGR